MKTERRSYRMKARADSVQATRARILEAAHAEFMAEWYDEVRLGDIAAAAGVSQQTLINHFGTKQQLFTAMLVERFGPETVARRFAVEPGDVPGAIEALVAEYDRAGDAGPRFSVMGDRLPELREAYELGRASHREWNEHVFGPFLQALPARERERRLRVLISITDVLMWKLLRRDQGLSRPDTIAALRQLAEAVIHPERSTS